MSTPYIRVQNLTKAYPNAEATPALRGVSFDLKPGEVLGLLGPNGAGKTTTIRLLLSILSPTSGTIEFFGKDFAHHRSESLQRVGYASTYTSLPSFLTVHQNLDTQARFYGMSSTDRRQRITELLTFFELLPFLDRRFTELSAGQKTRVMLVKAFLCRPDVVLLDEPTASLDPDVAEQVRAFIETQRRTTQTSILLTSHNMEEVGRLCDRVIILGNGVIMAEDSPKNLARQADRSILTLSGVSAGKEAAQNFLQQGGFSFAVHDEGARIEIEADEQQLCDILAGVAAAGVRYREISVDHPSLESFFLKIAAQTRASSTADGASA